MQLGLKKAAKEGEDNPDGPQPAKARRGRRPRTLKASPKKKVKAKSKAAPKKAAAKSKTVPSSSRASASNASGKRTGKQAKLEADVADRDGLAAPVKAEGKPKEPKREKKPVEKEDVAPAADGAQKCFARRRRPAAAFPMAKFDAIRQAFQQKVKPLLVAYSAHEDRTISYVFAVACSSPSLLGMGWSCFTFCHMIPFHLETKTTCRVLTK